MVALVCLPRFEPENSGCLEEESLLGEIFEV